MLNFNSFALFIAWHWAERHRLAAAAGAALFALLLAYGAASAIGFAAENRTAMTSTGDNRNAILDAAIADLAAAESRFVALPSHRLQGVVEAEIAVLQKDRSWDSTSACKDATLPASRAFCKRIETLRGELAIAKEHATLSATLERLKLEIKQRREGGAGKETDPQARAITQLTGLDIANVRSGLTWLLALAVEAISAFGLFAITPRGSAGPAFSAQQAAERQSPWRLAARTTEHQRIGTARRWRLSARAG